MLDSAFTVPAGNWKIYEFSMGRGGGRIVGRFRAEGGSGNDIVCLILDQDGFENLRNHHAVRPYYNSGRVTVANIYAELGEGSYVLVFDNTFSAITPKAVTARVEMQWPPDY
jgi:hypothetical protein